MQNNVIEYAFKNEFQIADTKARIIAFVIDFCVFVIIGASFVYFFEMLTNGIGIDFYGTPTLILFLIGCILWPISEGIWGQTLGKRVLGIKVLTDHYEPIDITASITRYILGFVDYIFLIGLVIVANNKMNKRIGDMAANTIVVQM